MGEKKLGLSGYLHIREGYDELEDPPVPQKPKWCGGHKPGESDACPKHNRRWHELCRSSVAADESLLLRGVLSIFYCPILDCDKFDVCYDSSRAKIRIMDYYNECVFNNTISLKIILHRLALREGDGK